MKSLALLALVSASLVAVSCQKIESLGRDEVIAHIDKKIASLNNAMTMVRQFLAKVEQSASFYSSNLLQSDLVELAFDIEATRTDTLKSWLSAAKEYIASTGENALSPTQVYVFATMRGYLEAIRATKDSRAKMSAVLIADDSQRKTNFFDVYYTKRVQPFDQDMKVMMTQYNKFFSSKDGQLNERALEARLYPK